MPSSCDADVAERCGPYAVPRATESDASCRIASAERRIDEPCDAERPCERRDDDGSALRASRERPRDDDVYASGGEPEPELPHVRDADDGEPLRELPRERDGAADAPEPLRANDVRDADDDADGGLPQEPTRERDGDDADGGPQRRFGPWSPCDDACAAKRLTISRNALCCHAFDAWQLATFDGSSCALSP